MNAKDKKNLKWLGYILMAYFGYFFLINIILSFSSGYRETMGIINVILSPVILLFCVYCSYKITKKKKWALIAIILVLIYQIGTIFYYNSLLGARRVLITKIVSVAILLYSLKYFKKSKGVKHGI